MSVSKCSILQLPKISQPRGNISVIESVNQIPFSIERTYYLYDVPAGTSRGGHAHKQLEQLIIAVAGSFEVELDDGIDKKTFRLNKPFEGLYICPMVWRELHDFSSGSVCLVIASRPYEEDDYIREYVDFSSTAVTKAR